MNEYLKEFRNIPEIPIEFVPPQIVLTQDMFVYISEDSREINSYRSFMKLEENKREPAQKLKSTQEKNPPK